jgi:hypothetical protein
MTKFLGKTDLHSRYFFLLYSRFPTNKQGKPMARHKNRCIRICVIVCQPIKFQKYHCTFSFLLCTVPKKIQWKELPSLNDRSDLSSFFSFFFLFFLLFFYFPFTEQTLRSNMRWYFAWKTRPDLFFLLRQHRSRSKVEKILRFRRPNRLSVKHD